MDTDKTKSKFQRSSRGGLVLHRAHRSGDGNGRLPVLKKFRINR